MCGLGTQKKMDSHVVEVWTKWKAKQVDLAVFMLKSKGVDRPFNCGDCQAVDEQLMRFVLVDNNNNVEEQQQQITVADLSRNQRLWLYNRCCMLHLASQSTSEEKGGIKSVVVTKPLGWTFDPDSVCTAKMLLAAHRKQQSKKSKARKQARMQKWTTDCSECGKELSAHSALYCWAFDDGAMCEDCVESDPELRGLKWEDRASFF